MSRCRRCNKHNCSCGSREESPFASFMSTLGATILAGITTWAAIKIAERLCEAPSSSSCSASYSRTFRLSSPKQYEGETVPIPLSNASPVIQDIQCVICLENQRNVMLQPCGHAQVCQRCSYEISECPTCRAKISHRLRMYL